MLDDGSMHFFYGIVLDVHLHRSFSLKWPDETVLDTGSMPILVCIVLDVRALPSLREVQ
jgi:hypothetical protein